MDVEGGEGVRARTSTTFSSIDAGVAVAVKASRLPVSTALELGDSDRFATPSARAAATPVLGGDGDLERGTDSTTFKVKDIAADVDGAEVETGTDADTLWGRVESEDL